MHTYTIEKFLSLANKDYWTKEESFEAANIFLNLGKEKVKDPNTADFNDFLLDIGRSLFLIANHKKDLNSLKEVLKQCFIQHEPMIFMIQQGYTELLIEEIINCFNKENPELLIKGEIKEELYFNFSGDISLLIDLIEKNTLYDYVKNYKIEEIDFV